MCRSSNVPCGRHQQHRQICAAACPQTLSHAGSALRACCLVLRATPSAHPCAAQSHRRLPEGCRARHGHRTAAATHQSGLLLLRTSCNKTAVTTHMCIPDEHTTAGSPGCQRKAWILNTATQCGWCRRQYKQAANPARSSCHLGQGMSPASVILRHW